MTNNITDFSSHERALKDILEYAKNKQVMIAPEALFSLDNANYKTIIGLASDEGLFVISKTYVEDWKRKHSNILPVDEVVNKTVAPERIVEIQRTKHIPAKDVESDIKIIHASDISFNGRNQGKVSEFLAYFRERFEVLGGMLKRRPNISAMTSEDLRKRTNKNEEIVLIGMLSGKGRTKNDNIMLNFDDEEGQFKVVVTKRDEELLKLAENVVDDDVVAIRGTKLGDDIIIGKEIEYPDLQNRVYKGCARDLNAVVISDTHIGSNLFYGDEFQKFIDWISMKNDEDAELVGKIKYMFIAGDLVDGVGVYPQQINELDIFDVYEQFDKAYDYISQIPEHIEIIIGPGNHDPVRLADPQPAVDKEYAQKLFDLKNVNFVGSPSWIEIEGLKTLMYHGNSMFSLQFALNLDASSPARTMQEMLKRRDLAPIYGTRHPILPEKGGYTLIKEEPDIFITGHIHKNEYSNYKGTILVNPGTWQGQTSYQLEQGHHPTPGRVPVIELKTGKIIEKVFIDESS